jgi:WS/DGAT/MGAT family acyltransferase
MQQLTGLDAIFILQEDAHTPMHISPLMLYEPSTASGKSVRFKDILATFQRNLHKSPVFRRKLVRVPMNLDQPYWVEDKHFDLEFHVRHIALPKPGDWRQLCIQVARLHAQGLDMTRPLWEAYVIGGLNDVAGLPRGSFAILLKVHHSAIDGVSGADVVNTLHSLNPEAGDAEPEDDWQGEASPSTWKIWSGSYINSWRRPLKMMATVGHLIPRLYKLRNADKGEKTEIHVRTRFNGPISNYRVSDAIRMDLADIKAIKSAVTGATINDVMMTIVGGALRRYLLAKNELPSGSLGAMVPISVRSEDQKGSGGNRVSVMMLCLGTDIADPEERLHAVHDAAVKSKAYASAMGLDSMIDIAESLSSQVATVGIRAASMLARLPNTPIPAHVVVSNVPGPQVPLYMSGARLHTLLGLGPVMDNMGLFHAVLSYSGSISIMFVACREMLPDPGFYADCLKEAFNELKRASA